MKKFIVPLITALTTLILIGCSKQENTSLQVEKADIVGKWVSRYNPESFWLLNSDGSGFRCEPERVAMNWTLPENGRILMALENGFEVGYHYELKGDVMTAWVDGFEEIKTTYDRSGSEGVTALEKGTASKSEETNELRSEKESRGLIGATCMDIANPFFKVIEENMRDEAAKHGYDLIYLGAENDVSKQQKQIKDFLVKEVVAIAVNPTNSEAIGTAVKEANNANVPVFSFDVRVQAEGAKVVSHVGTDNAQGGELAGQAMVDALGEEGGKVVIIDYRGVESCMERVKGFKKVIDSYNSNRESGKIEIVAELSGDGKRDKGFKAAEDSLQRVPDMRGIFAINDPSGLGAVGALEKAGKLDQVTVIAFDGMPAGKKAIKEGKIYADPIQHPDKIGRECIKAIVAYLSGEDVKPNIDIPATLYTKETADADTSPD